MNNYIILFNIYSVLGFIFEITLKLIMTGKLESVYIRGPWIPLYGLGCIIITVIYNIIYKNKESKFIKILFFYIIATITLTILEFISGHLMESFTGIIAWDYTFLKLHIGKYIALEVSFMWSLFAILIAYILNPIIYKIIKKIPNILTYSVFTIIIIDFINTALLLHLFVMIFSFYFAL